MQWVIPKCTKRHNSFAWQYPATERLKHGFLKIRHYQSLHLEKQKCLAQIWSKKMLPSLTQWVIPKCTKRCNAFAWQRPEPERLSGDFLKIRHYQAWLSLHLAKQKAKCTYLIQKDAPLIKMQWVIPKCTKRRNAFVWQYPVHIRFVDDLLRKAWLSLDLEKQKVLGTDLI